MSDLTMEGVNGSTKYDVTTEKIGIMAKLDELLQPY